MTQITSLGVFYKNDVPEGFGLASTDPQQAQQIASIMDAMYQAFKRQPKSEQMHFLAVDIWEQLHEASRLHKLLAGEDWTLEQQRQFLILGPCNVHILELTGCLSPTNSTAAFLRKWRLGNPL